MTLVADTRRYYLPWRSSTQFLFAVCFTANNTPSFLMVPYGLQKYWWLFAGWVIISRRNGGELWSQWPLPWVIIFSGSPLGVLCHLSHLDIRGTIVPFPAQFRRSFWSALLEAIEIYDIYCQCSSLNLKSPPITPLGVIISLSLLQPSNVTLGTLTVLFLEYPHSAR